MITVSATRDHAVPARPLTPSRPVRSSTSAPPKSWPPRSPSSAIRRGSACVDALAHGELCVSDLSAVVGLSESAVSHQLRLLRSLRIVRARRAGRQVYYQLDDAHIRTLLDQGRRHIEEARP